MLLDYIIIIIVIIIIVQYITYYITTFITFLLGGAGSTTGGFAQEISTCGVLAPMAASGWER